jgi:hypothetical protein
VIAKRPNGQRLGQRLRLQRLVTGTFLTQSLELQFKPPIDVLGLAVSAGFLREQDVDEAKRALRRSQPMGTL